MHLFCDAFQQARGLQKPGMPDVLHAASMPDVLPRHRRGPVGAQCNPLVRGVEAERFGKKKTARGERDRTG